MSPDIWHITSSSSAPNECERGWHFTVNRGDALSDFAAYHEIYIPNETTDLGQGILHCPDPHPTLLPPRGDRQIVGLSLISAEDIEQHYAAEGKFKIPDGGYQSIPPWVSKVQLVLSKYSTKLPQARNGSNHQLTRLRFILHRSNFCNLLALTGFAYFESANLGSDPLIQGSLQPVDNAVYARQSLFGSTLEIEKFIHIMKCRQQRR
ncbi:hypothetical protein BDV29DRAFT_152815 [Aspergillus leporis]|uniref:Uncharacterized protein n=1 Tax=Aspergillus leporis TaxID=41062 RepID=A0A5N5XC91_9EURO|nr:hypothetical protein BDV29DRAFT_152815 [Aspergillus leporis]